jgi:hypothetical protein
MLSASPTPSPVDAALRYRQFLEERREGSGGSLCEADVGPAAAAAAAAAAASSGAVAAAAGGRNAPLTIVRQLSATTLPPSALGFGSSGGATAGLAATDGTAMTAAGGQQMAVPHSAGQQHQQRQHSGAAWMSSPFATEASTVLQSEQQQQRQRQQQQQLLLGEDALLPPAGSLLLPLSRSDGVMLDAADGDPDDGSTAASEGAFSFRGMLAQVLSSPDAAAPPLPADAGNSGLLSFDAVAARLPRAVPARLYPPVTARGDGVLWDAVQQAFAFFASSEAPNISSATAASAGSTSIGALDLTGSSARRQHAQATAAAADSGTPRRTSISSAGVGMASSSSAAAAAAGASDPTVTGHLLSSVIGIVGSSSTGAAAGGARGPLTPGGNSLVAPPAPPVCALNDILEIRTDMTPVRMISRPDRPPQV